MPVKDHMVAFKSSNTSFKPKKHQINEVLSLTIVESAWNSWESGYQLHLKIIMFEKKFSCLEWNEPSKD